MSEVWYGENAVKYEENLDRMLDVAREIDRVTNNIIVTCNLILTVNALDDFYYDGSIEDWISMSKETNKLSINNFYFINDNGDKSFNNKNYSKIDTYTITKSKIDDYDYAYFGIRKIIIPRTATAPAPQNRGVRGAAAVPAAAGPAAPATRTP